MQPQDRRMRRRRRRTSQQPRCICASKLRASRRLNNSCSSFMIFFPLSLGPPLYILLLSSSFSASRPSLSPLLTARPRALVRQSAGANLVSRGLNARAQTLSHRMSPHVALHVSYETYAHVPRPCPCNSATEAILLTAASTIAPSWRLFYASLYTLGRRKALGVEHAHVTRGL